MAPQNFSFRCLVYREPNQTFTAVCLDLDIVEEGHLTLEEAKLSLDDAIEAHIRAAAEVGFPRELRHRPAPKKYWKKLREISTEKELSTPLGITPFQFFVINTGQNFSYA